MNKQELELLSTLATPLSLHELLDELYISCNNDCINEDMFSLGVEEY